MTQPSTFLLPIEKYAPLVIATFCAYIFWQFDFFDNVQPKDNQVDTVHFFLSTIILAALITHKGIVLSVNRAQHKGFDRLLNNNDLKKRFFKYLNHPIYNSILIICYSVICEYNKTLCFSGVHFFLTLLLVLQTLRFSWVFNIVFEKSINNE